MDRISEETTTLQTEPQTASEPIENKKELSKRERKKQEKSEKKAQKKQEKEKQKKLMRLPSTQMYSPVRDVRDGIVVTKDRRYIKIMEFSPVNLALRAGGEKDVIISAFAAALKIMPKTVQFKVLTRRADTERYLEQIIADLKNKTCQGIITLAAERADMIESIASRGGVSRRFFLIFEYEKDDRSTQKTRWSDIRSQLFYQIG